MRQRTSSAFWTRHREPPAEVREVADKHFRLLKRDPRHPSLRFKRIGKSWSARVGENHRALGFDVDDGICWYWIGTHAEYDRLIR